MRKTCPSRVLVELRRSKQSHWMWFIFPQLARLGHSTMASGLLSRQAKKPSPDL
jgi:uncharacterized protein (DUF1810 family)